MKHQLGDRVKLIESKESGCVIARAEFLHSEPSYLIRYQRADGPQVENWHGESALRATF